MCNYKIKTVLFIEILLFVLIIPLKSNAQDKVLYKTEIFSYGGIPISTFIDDTLIILENHCYTVGYSEKFKVPIWTVYRLGNRSGELFNTKWERPFRFYTDHRTKSKVSHQDFFNKSGYDRGHMAPNASIAHQYGQMAQLETFLISNICPQHKDLNRYLWAELETIERELLSQIDSANNEVHDLYVTTGPIIPQTDYDTLNSGIAIPESFYKIFAFRMGYSGIIKAVAFIIPQHPSSNDLADFYVSINEIETRTGLNFFPALSQTRQHNLESVKRDLQLKILLY